jgi:membrane associated rhomboid family serine protease
MGVGVVRSRSISRSISSRKARQAESLLNRDQILIVFLIWALWLFHATTGNFFSIVRILASVLGALWLVWLVNAAFLRNRLNFLLGIYARRIEGLIGIVCAPFLHADIDHISGNSQVFLIWGSLVLMTGIDNFALLTVITALTSGLGVWLFGQSRRPTIGFSGVLFGYFGFLVARGYFSREPLPAILSIAALFFYYFQFLNLFPTRPSVSWKGHIFGFLGGVATAYYLTPLKAIFPFQWFQFLM